MIKIRVPRGQRGLIVWAFVSAAVVAATAFSGSYQHQYQLLIRFGQAHWYAAVQPLSVEGLVLTATLMNAFASSLGLAGRRVWAAYLALVLGIGQAALMNVAISYPDWWWLKIEINVWPAIAFAAAYEMTSWMLNHRPVKVNEGQSPSEPAAPPTPTDLPGFEPELVAQTFGTPPEIVIPESDDLPDDLMVSTEGLRELADEQFRAEVPRLEVPVKQINLVNGSEPVHTCNNGEGPKGGKKTPGCPRCDAILNGQIAPKGARKPR